ncbi:MAG: hypothetical protein LBK63_01000 [Treponema sp.]|jgi:hypothetical protein|nr:hypothetical protein [Treponema sp.]
MSLFKRKLSGETGGGLDDPGKAFRDRLIRLGAKKSSAYTALSLLKGYGSFKIGACLDLNNNVYKSYALVGLGITKLSVSLAGLLQEDQAFAKIPNPESLDLNFFNPEMNLWIFALDDFDPCRRLLLLAEEKGSSFSPETIGLILAETNELFFPSAIPDLAPEGFDLELPEGAKTEADQEFREEPEQALQPEIAEPALPAEYSLETIEGTRAKIAEYQQSNGVFQGILLEIPGGGAKPGYSFAKQVATMVGVLGRSFAVPSRRILILIPPRFDRELIAHRLSTSFATEVLACFAIDDPDKALELIQPYL